MTKYKSNHPFTVAQLKAVNKELQRISSAQIVLNQGLKASLPAKTGFVDIEVLRAPFVLDVFINYWDIGDPDYPASFTIKIDANGKVDYHPRLNMGFNTLADRVTFFNSLTPITFTKAS